MKSITFTNTFKLPAPDFEPGVSISPASISLAGKAAFVADFTGTAGDLKIPMYPSYGYISVGNTPVTITSENPKVIAYYTALKADLEAAGVATITIEDVVEPDDTNDQGGSGGLGS